METVSRWLGPTAVRMLAYLFGGRSGEQDRRAAGTSEVEENECRASPQRRDNKRMVHSNSAAQQGVSQQHVRGCLASGSSLRAARVNGETHAQTWTRTLARCFLPPLASGCPLPYPEKRQGFAWQLNTQLHSKTCLWLDWCCGGTAHG